MTRGQGVRTIAIGLVWIGMLSLPTAAWGACTWISGGTYYYCNGEIRVRDSTGTYAMQLLSSSTGSVLGSMSNVALALQTNSTEQMRITGQGDVGIGIASPYHWNGYKSVTVAGTDGSEIRVQNSGAESVGQWYSYWGQWGGATVFGTATGTGLELRTAGQERMRITPGGYVGINDANPDYLLSVNGTIGAKDVVVTNSGWSDYVFRPGYRLRPLSEVDRFIQKHRHLPDIPTEAEVKKNGVSVGEMQAKLLAKVEELSLYVIEQDKENRALRERLARLEARVAGK